MHRPANIKKSVSRLSFVISAASLLGIAQAQESGLLGLPATSEPVPATSTYPFGLLDGLQGSSTSSTASSAGQSFGDSAGQSLGLGSSPTISAAAAPSVGKLETSSPAVVRSPAITTGTPRDPLAPREPSPKRVSMSVRSSIEMNDNVFIDREDEQDDVVAVIAPTLSVNTGDFRRQQATYLSAAYTATASVYLDNTAEDTLDHQLLVGGQWREGKLTVPFEINAGRTTAAFVDIGGRDTAITYGGRVGLEYAFSPKLTLGGSVEYAETDYTLFADFSQVIAEAFVGYQATTKTRLGVAYRYSDSEVAGADSQKYQAALLRADSRVGSKVTTTAEVGAAFSDLGRGDRTDLVYRLGVSYQPSSKSRLSFQALRQPSTSSFTVGSGLINNGFQLGYEQAIGTRTRALMTVGYQMQDYFAADEGVVTTREDDFFTFSASVAYDISESWSANLFYSYSNNDSSDPSLGFDNQRVGMGLNWTY